jgi:hypothetical protein
MKTSGGSSRDDEFDEAVRDILEGMADEAAGRVISVADAFAEIRRELELGFEREG